MEVRIPAVPSVPSSPTSDIRASRIPLLKDRNGQTPLRLAISFTFLFVFTCWYGSRIPVPTNLNSLPEIQKVEHITYSEPGLAAPWNEVRTLCLSLSNKLK